MKILITGDFYPSGRIADLVHSNKIEYLFGDFLQFISSSDLVITNLEAPLTNSSNPIQKTGPNIKAPIATADFLRLAGFNLVTLANNHVMDFGKAGLSDTIDALRKQKMNFIGAGLNETEIKEPFIFEKDGIKVGILNFCENEWSTADFGGAGANPIDPINNYYSIKDLKKKVDVLLVITHGGHEYYNLPSPDIQKLLRFYIDAGANAVINHHPHFISGFEIYKSYPIFYSLGNFVFDKGDVKNPLWNSGAATNLIINKNEPIKFEYITFDQCSDEPVIRLHDIEKRKQIKNYIDNLNEIIINNSLLKEEFIKHIKAKERLYRYYIEPHSSRILGFLQNKKLFPSLWNAKKKKYLYNLIRAEFHRELVIKILGQDVSNTQK